MHLTNYYFSDFCKIDWHKYKMETESGNIIILKKSYFLPNFVSNCLKYNGSTFGIYVTLYPKNCKKSLNVFNIHLDDQFYQTRNAQLNSIKDLLLGLKYCILGGDFNQEYDPKSKLYSIKGFTVHNKSITYFIEDYINIDNILTKGFLKINTFVSYDYENIAKQSLFDLFGSDHIPIIVKLLQK